MIASKNSSNEKHNKMNSLIKIAMKPTSSLTSFAIAAEFVKLMLSDENFHRAFEELSKVDAEICSPFLLELLEQLLSHKEELSLPNKRLMESFFRSKLTRWFVIFQREPNNVALPSLLRILSLALQQNILVPHILQNMSGLVDMYTDKSCSSHPLIPQFLLQIYLDSISACKDELYLWQLLCVLVKIFDNSAILSPKPPKVQQRLVILLLIKASWVVRQLSLHEREETLLTFETKLSQHATEISDFADELFGLLGDQDDYVVEALYSLLLLTKSNNQNCELFPPHQLFFRFLSNVKYDHLVLMDFLLSDETTFLPYLMQYLRYASDSKETLPKQTIHTLKKLKNTLESLDKGNHFPYNIKPLLKKLETI